MITKRSFGKIPTGEVTAYTLDNGCGLSAEILDLGGIVRKLVYDGTDVVLGRETANDYVGDPTYFGALIGRNSNRIEGGRFTLNEKNYTLALNDNGTNNLHGGNVGFNAKIWSAGVLDEVEPKLTLSLFSPDGEEGFPGNVNVMVTYTLTKENSLKIHYEAKSDADTIVNMTNHSYFNLNGHKDGNILDHTLELNSSFFTPGKDTCVPDGSVIAVDSTPFDFRTAKTVGQDIDCKDEQIQKFLGYDHNFAIDGFGYRKFATLCGNKTGIVMECFTDQVAVQLYTGNYVNDEILGKDGCAYAKHQGLCLETQTFPNAINYSHFPSAVLKKGEKYDTVTEYKFSKK